MVGYYKLDQKEIEQLKIECHNIEENIYHLCCPLIVKDKKMLDKELLYLYEMLEIPMITLEEVDQFDFEKSKEQQAYLDEFSSYLELNIKIEMIEEQKLGHLLRVAKYARELAEHIKLSKEHIKRIYIAALFHDIGKYLIPEEVLGKPGKLTDEEFEMIQKHCIFARQIVDQFLNEEIIEMIESHHERLDESGYYMGITPSIGAQIIGIADSYDAITSNRIYHNAEKKEEAFKELLLCTQKKEEGGKGTLYDPELVNKFIEIQRGYEN